MKFRFMHYGLGLALICTASSCVTKPRKTQILTCENSGAQSKTRYTVEGKDKKTKVYFVESDCARGNCETKRKSYLLPNDPVELIPAFENQSDQNKCVRFTNEKTGKHTQGWFPANHLRELVPTGSRVSDSAQAADETQILNLLCQSHGDSIPTSCTRKKEFVCDDEGEVPFIIFGEFYKTGLQSAFLTISGCNTHSGGDSFTFVKSEAGKWKVADTEDTFGPSKCWKLEVKGETTKLLCLQDYSYAFDTLRIWTPESVNPILRWVGAPDDGFSSVTKDGKAPHIRQAKLQEVAVSEQNTDAPKVALKLKLETAVLPVTDERDSQYFIDEDEDEIKKRLKVEDVLIEWKYNKKLKGLEVIRASKQKLDQLKTLFEQSEEQ